MESAKGGACRRYNCSNFLRRGRSVCEGNRVPVKDLEEQILEHLSRKLFSRDRIREIVLQVSRQPANLRRRNNAKAQGLKRELEDVRARIKRHYEAIERGAIELTLVAERLNELKEWQTELQGKLEHYERPKPLPPYLLREDNLAEIQVRLTEIFMSNQHVLTKRYLNFLLERIEIKGNEVQLVRNSAALCSFALARKTEGTVNHTGTVPPVDLSWYPGPDSNRRHQV